MFLGRINRTDFFLAVILHITVIVGLGWLIVNIYSKTWPDIFRSTNLLFSLLLIILSILGLLAQISLVSLFIRRLHDMDISGWKSLFAIIPVVNIFFGFYIFLFPGTKGDNSYGGDLSEFPFWYVVLGKSVSADVSGISVSRRRQIVALFVLAIYVVFLLLFLQ